MAEIFWSSIRIYFHILFILEPKECCSKVGLVGAHQTKLNQNYTKENELVNDMPYYVDNEKRYGIWFDPSWLEWNIGFLSDEDALLYTSEFVECPSDANDWKEYFDGEWNINLNATLSGTNLNATDYSKWRKYSGSRFE